MELSRQSASSKTKGSTRSQSSCRNRNPGLVIEHWDGHKWSLVTSASGVLDLEGVTALSDGTVVAVGEGTNGSAVILEN
jgi:hypothetical protein